MYDELDFINNENIDELQILHLSYDVKLDISCHKLDVSSQELNQMKKLGQDLKEELFNQIYIQESEDVTYGKKPFYLVSIFCNTDEIASTIEKITSIGLVLKYIHNNRTGWSYYIPQYANYSHFI